VLVVTARLTVRTVERILPTRTFGGQSIGARAVLRRFTVPISEYALRYRSNSSVLPRSSRYSSAVATTAATQSLPTAQHARPRRQYSTASSRAGYFTVATLWVLLLLEPQSWLAAHGLEVLLKLPTVVFGILTVQLLVSGLRGGFYAPLLALVLMTAATTPFTYNIGFAMDPLKKLVLIYLLALGTLRFVTTARQATFLLILAMLWQYLWYGFQGVLTGSVWWHSMLANEDAFGPLMVLGIAACLYVGLAANRRLRVVALIGCAVCVLGLVSSFARGATVAGALVAAIIWLRSPRKGLMTAVFIGMAGVVLVATLVIFRDTSRSGSKTGFWNEMMTIQEDAGGAGTGGDRYALWDAALRVFYAHPIFGAGAENFGPAAAELLRVGEVKGMYAENPGMLYQRKLHNAFYQALSEYGVVGSAIFVWLLAHFWWSNARLRSPPYVAAWRILGGTLDLRHVALGLEAAVVGFLGCAFFYNLLFEQWLFTLLILNMLLYQLVRDTAMLQPISGPAMAWRRSAHPIPVRPS
jgi:O-antigen ligase